MSEIKARMALARAIQLDPTADHSEVRRHHRTERLAEFIQRTLDGIPPLTPKQVDRLTLLLRGEGEGRGPS